MILGPKKLSSAGPAARTAAPDAYVKHPSWRDWGGARLCRPAWMSPAPALFGVSGSRAGRRPDGPGGYSWRTSFALSLARPMGYRLRPTSGKAGDLARFSVPKPRLPE